jgi:putative membrane protein
MAEKHPVRGVLAGIAGGLVASWAMNVWSEGPGSAISKRVESPEEQKQISQQSDGEDATMKTADALASTFEHGQHLSKEEKQEGGPIVHYTYGALVGGLYGLLAEYVPLVRSGFGTTYGSALFVGGDLVAVPALGLSKPLSEYPASSYVAPFTAHLIYGATTELVRRTARLIL